MAQIDNINLTIGVTPSIEDETAELCIAILNIWLKNGNRHLELFKKENGAQFLIETD